MFTRQGNLVIEPTKGRVCHTSGADRGDVELEHAQQFLAGRGVIVVGIRDSNMLNMTGWWWLEPWNFESLSRNSWDSWIIVVVHFFMDFSRNSWECHHPSPDKLTPWFFRRVGGSTTHQMNPTVFPFKPEKCWMWISQPCFITKEAISTLHFPVIKKNIWWFNIHSSWTGKIHPCYYIVGKASISIRAIYTMANCECHNQVL